MSNCDKYLLFQNSTKDMQFSKLSVSNKDGDQVKEIVVHWICNKLGTFGLPLGEHWLTYYSEHINKNYD